MGSQVNKKQGEVEVASTLVFLIGNVTKFFIQREMLILAFESEGSNFNFATIHIETNLAAKPTCRFSQLNRYELPYSIDGAEILLTAKPAHAENINLELTVTQQAPNGVDWSVKRFLIRHTDQTKLFRRFRELDITPRQPEMARRPAEESGTIRLT